MASRFPHLVTKQQETNFHGERHGTSFQTISSQEMSRSKLIPWMPTLVVTRQIYLGRHEQAEERSVVGGLEITHVLSIGRYEWNYVEYYEKERVTNIRT